VIIKSFNVDSKPYRIKNVVLLLVKNLHSLCETMVKQYES